MTEPFSEEQKASPKIQSFKDCPYNVSEDSCPNCEREDCPIEQHLVFLSNNLDLVADALIREYEGLKKK